MPTGSTNNQLNKLDQALPMQYLLVKSERLSGAFPQVAVKQRHV